MLPAFVISLSLPSIGRCHVLRRADAGPVLCELTEKLRFEFGAASVSTPHIGNATVNHKQVKQGM